MDFRKQKEEEDNTNNPSFPKPLLPSSSSLLNGASSHQNPSQTTETERRESPKEPPKYRECLRNHAAIHGGHILDGCGEFMPTSTDNMKCAACNCHRSFHRRDSEKSNLFPLLLPPPRPLPQQKNIHFFGNASGGTTTESSSEEIGIPTVGGRNAPFVNPKKRFRTKFSQEQKVRMMDFAERIGWRIQRQDEGEMVAFCAGIGVSRQVFKVWMHNNKHLVLKQEEQRHLPQPNEGI